MANSNIDNTDNIDYTLDYWYNHNQALIYLCVNEPGFHQSITSLHSVQAISEYPQLFESLKLGPNTKENLRRKKFRKWWTERFSKKTIDWLKDKLLPSYMDRDTDTDPIIQQARQQFRNQTMSGINNNNGIPPRHPGGGVPPRPPSQPRVAPPPPPPPPLQQQQYELYNPEAVTPASPILSRHSSGSSYHTQQFQPSVLVQSPGGYIQVPVNSLRAASPPPTIPTLADASMAMMSYNTNTINPYGYGYGAQGVYGNNQLSTDNTGGGKPPPSPRVPPPSPRVHRKSGIPNAQECVDESKPIELFFEQGHELQSVKELYDAITRDDEHKKEELDELLGQQGMKASQKQAKIFNDIADTCKMGKAVMEQDCKELYETSEKHLDDSLDVFEETLQFVDNAFLQQRQQSNQPASDALQAQSAPVSAGVQNLGMTQPAAPFTVDPHHTQYPPRGNLFTATANTVNPQTQSNATGLYGAPPGKLFEVTGAGAGAGGVKKPPAEPNFGPTGVFSGGVNSGSQTATASVETATAHTEGTGASNAPPASLSGGRFMYKPAAAPSSIGNEDQKKPASFFPQGRPIRTMDPSGEFRDAPTASTTTRSSSKRARFASRNDDDDDSMMQR